MKNERLSRIREILEPIMNETGFELVDVEFVKEGRENVLRVFIDKEGGVFIDDCQKVSESLSLRLDEDKFIKEHYLLEVSSPGLDRPLKTQRDFDKNLGKEVEVKLFEPVLNKKIFSGVLQGLRDDTLLITDTNGVSHAFSMKSVAIVKKVIKF